MNHIVLYNPAIPQNTGNIMRTCVATNTKLHLIKPLGFELDDKRMKRAGLDYIDYLDYKVHENWEEFLALNKGVYFFLTRYAKTTYSDATFVQEQDVYLVFGHEHDGIPLPLLKQHEQTCLRIPMTDHVRSLNVSNCATMLIYEALRQQGFPNLSKVEVQKGEDFLFES